MYSLSDGNSRSISCPDVRRTAGKSVCPNRLVLGPLLTLELQRFLVTYPSPEVERPDGATDHEDLAEDTVPFHGLSVPARLGRRTPTGEAEHFGIESPRFAL